MNKNQKLLLGVAVVGIGGYLLWKSTQKKTFANLRGQQVVKQCCGHVEEKIQGTTKLYTCCNRRDVSEKSAGNPCADCLKARGQASTEA